MKAALNQSLKPRLQEIGFVGSISKMHRMEGDFVYVLSVLFNKHATAFVLEFGPYPVVMLTAGSGIHAVGKVGISDVSVMARARLCTESGLWFSFGRLADDAQSYASLAIGVGNVVRQVDQWILRRACGPNISSFAAPARN